MRKREINCIVLDRMRRAAFTWSAASRHSTSLRGVSPPHRIGPRRAASATAAAAAANRNSAAANADPAHHLSFEAVAELVTRGRKFHCTGCAKCCSCEHGGKVWVSRDEVAALAALLGLTPSQFVATHCRDRASVDGNDDDDEDDDDPIPPGYELLRTKQSAATGETVCCFLDEATNMCSVYPARPVQCATYPMWPEILGRHGGWEWERGERGSGDKTMSFPSDLVFFGATSPPR